MTRADKIYYLKANLVWTELATLKIVQEANRAWAVGKLVIDFNTNKYMRFIFNEIEHDLSSYDIKKAANAAKPILQLYGVYMARAAASKTGYLDNVIVTQNEV